MKILKGLFLLVSVITFFVADAQNLKRNAVPAAVKASLIKNYPKAKNVTWEKEKSNFEANWGGKSGEDNSVQFTPAGNFIEMIKAISVSELPPAVQQYVKTKYKGAQITEAGKVTDAKGNISFEAAVNGKDIIFDKDGNFVKAEH